MQALLDGLGTERGEQRLIDRADAPGTQYRDQQLHGPWHQPGDAIARSDALTAQEIAELRCMDLQLLEGVLRGDALLRLAIQGHCLFA